MLWQLKKVKTSMINLIILIHETRSGKWWVNTTWTWWKTLPKTSRSANVQEMLMIMEWKSSWITWHLRSGRKIGNNYFYKWYRKAISFPPLLGSYTPVSVPHLLFTLTNLKVSHTAEPSPCSHQSVMLWAMHWSYSFPYCRDLCITTQTSVTSCCILFSC